MQLKEDRAPLLAIVDDIVPSLTIRYGVGPVSTAPAIVSFPTPSAAAARPRSPPWGHQPDPASSGRTIRHRLNRGGDRALTAPCHHGQPDAQLPATRAHTTRRTAEGKTTLEFRRCLKRYIARELYRQLNQAMRRS